MDGFFVSIPWQKNSEAKKNIESKNEISKENSVFMLMCESSFLKG